MRPLVKSDIVDPVTLYQAFRVTSTHSGGSVSASVSASASSEEAPIVYG